MIRIIKSPTAYYLEEEYKHYAVNKSCRPLNNQAGGLFCMENFQVYRDIQARTGGDIYIGVVGPVRTGKSTFIRRFMELADKC